MDAVASTPAHTLLERKDKADNHSTRKTQSATQSFFSSFGFDTSATADTTKNRQQLTQTANQHNPLKSHSLSMLTTLQSVDSAAKTA